MLNKILNRFIGDERMRGAYGKAAVITLLLMWLYMCIRMLLIVWEIWETNYLINDLYFLLISIVVFIFVATRKESPDTLIRSFLFTNELSVEEGAFFSRFKIYLVESFIGAIVLTVISQIISPFFINQPLEFDLLLFISGIISFTVILSIVYTGIGESAVRKYRKEFDE